MKSAIFMSASVPEVGRGDFYKNADPFLIHTAVRELMATVLGRRVIVWGGHPAITPMVWAVCEDLGVNYADTAVLYQSRFYKELYPDANANFKNVEYIDAIDNDKEKSLLEMRKVMLSRSDIEAAVFIGGMEGIFEEWRLFNKYHPGKPVIAVGAGGGAARTIAQDLGEQCLDDVDFVSLFHSRLKIPFNEPRETVVRNATQKPPGGRRGP